MAFSIYHHPLVYRWAMKLAYGREYVPRYAAVAEALGGPAEVLEVCCGDLMLHRYLLGHGLLTSYRGLDLAPVMVARGQRQGVDVARCDVRATETFPTAEVVVMQASLCQFQDMGATVLARLWRASRRMLLVSEPVRNLSQSHWSFVRRLSLVLSRPTDGRDIAFRHTEETLRALYAEAGVPISSVTFTPGRKEMIVTSSKAPQ